jgi:hypothetical protein
MDRVAAYAELTRELARWKALDYSQLCEHVGALPSERRYQHAGAEYLIEVRVRSSPSDDRSLIIEATACDANWFANTRIDESVVVHFPET